MFDRLILGAGFAGSVLAERQTRIDRARVILIDRRPHPAGSAYDPCDDAGIRFLASPLMSSTPTVMRCSSTYPSSPSGGQASIGFWPVSRANWCRYRINVRTINTLFETNLTPVRATAFLAETAEPRERIETAEDVVVSKCGCRLYESLCNGCSRTPWIRDPASLPKQVTVRIPASSSFDRRYFTNNHSAMLCDGYTAMVHHPNINL